MLILTVTRPLVGEVKATLSGGQWSCSNPGFLAVLKLVRLDNGYYPDRDLALMQEVARWYHGTIEDTRHRPVAVPDRVY